MSTFSGAFLTQDASCPDAFIKASTWQPSHSLSPHVTEAQLHLQGKVCGSPQIPRGCSACPTLSPNERQAARGVLHFSGITVLGPFISTGFPQPCPPFPGFSPSLWRTFQFTDYIKPSPKTWTPKGSGCFSVEQSVLKPECHNEHVLYRPPCITISRDSERTIFSSAVPNQTDQWFWG